MAICDIFVPVIVCLIYTVVCIITGLAFYKILNRFFGSPDTYPPLFRVANALLLGTGVITCILLSLSLLRLFSFGILVIFLTVLLISDVIILNEDVKRIFFEVCREKKPNFPQEVNFLFYLSLLLLALEGISAIILPPIGDAAAFYMVLPRQIVSLHGLFPLPGYESFTQIGLVGELHFAVLILFGTSVAAKLFTWIVFTGALVILCQIGTRAGLGQNGKVIILAVMLTSSAFTLLIADGKVDWFAAAMGLTAFFWALEFSDQQRYSSLVLSGFFTGIAIVAKISYIYTFLPGVLVLIYWNGILVFFRNHNRKSLITRNAILSAAKSGLVFGFCVFFPFSFNIAKNTVLFSQPLAPFITSGESSWVHQIWYTPENATWIISTYPFSLVFGQYPMQYGNLSPLFLAFLPLVFFIHGIKTDKKEELEKIVACTGCCIIMSVIINPFVFAPRYLLAPLALMMIIPSAGAESVYNNWAKKPLIRQGIILMTILLLLLTIFGVSFNIYSAVTQGECNTVGPICYASQVINNQAGMEDRILFLGYYSYWMNDNLITNLSSTKERESVLKTLQSPEERLQYLQKNEFRYIFSDGSFKNVSEGFNSQKMLQDGRLQKIYEEGDVVVYKITLAEGSD